MWSTESGGQGDLAPDFDVLMRENGRDNRRVLRLEGDRLRINLVAEFGGQRFR